ncbi:MAG: serine/threonine protein kinase [Gemmatimonadales bacterium]|jgi:serine/threonine-protein kinase|nr:MAG: serine/threonine protein kinase [Gemmatimonadales bacterium]
MKPHEVRSPTELAAALGDEFEVVRILGSGSVATVYLAREKALSRLVAIKVMDPLVSADETARRRFEREARAAASLSDNPNVVAVHRYGRLPDGTPYMVMRFVKGRTMEERLKAEGRLSVEQAIETLRSVADALALAHSKGFVHRDIRPGNVLWDEEGGRALLSDFGIAAILATSGAEGTRLTMAGELIGNPEYLSPEQLLDQDLTEMADIYAFGILGYELLAGEGPYDARSRTDMIKAHLTMEPRDLGSLRPEAPPAVAALLKRCLAREPNHRPSAADVLRTLEGGQGGGTAVSATGDEISDIQTLLKKRVPQVVIGTAVLGFGFTTVISDFADRGALRDSAYLASWVFTATAVAIAAIVAWFHGEKGRQRAPALEYVLLGVIGVAGLALSAWIYFTG